MTRQANIVSFDDAKAASRSRNAQRRTSRTGSASSNYAPLRMPSGRPGRAAEPLRIEEPQDFELDEERQPKSNARKKDAKAEARQRRRRERTKARADRMFDRQFEGKASQPEPEEGAPRAALYEGKMGSKHRRSTRMQRASVALPQSAKINPAGWFSNLNVSRRALRLGTALLCIVLVGVFLYTPAQQYYQAQREHDKLAAEYASLEQRNDVLNSQNTTLSSNAGMEDAVREKYGYVKSGDQTAVVTGLSDTTTDPARDSDAIEANVLSSAVKAPEEWYTPYLDAFFGVS